MNKEVAHILKERLAEFQFVDVVAGMAQTVEYATNDGDGRKVLQRMPYSTDVAKANDCHIGEERALVPDSKKRGVLYFEDMGLNFRDRDSNNHLHFSSKLILVCWMNKARLVGDNYLDVSTYALTQALDKMKVKTISNVGNFSRFNVMPGRILRQDKSVFSRYSYDETINQYLMPPFEFFGIELDISFSIHPKCVEKITLTDPSCY